MRSLHGIKRTKIENESRVTSDTKRCIDEGFVPTDMLIEILRRLPVKSLARFLLVSKLWSRIILSRDFVRLFTSQPSLLQPPLLFAFEDLDNLNKKKIWNFISSSSTSKPITYRFSLTSPHSRDNYLNEVPHYINGLISLGCGGDQIICNPSTGQSIRLAKVRSREQIFRSFFGYDPIDGRYKVLCVSENVDGFYRPRYTPSSEHRILTLGDFVSSWRTIHCEILHRPKTNNICIVGVVYYGAFTGTEMNEWCIMSFDVRSEKFDQVGQYKGDHSPPSLMKYRQPSLISYKGKVTLAIETQHLRFELWVLEDAEKHEWSKICFSIHHPWKDLLGHFFGLGSDITHTDEIVFVLHRVPGCFCFVYYDHKNDILRNIVEVSVKSNKNLKSFSVVVPFFNYVEVRGDMLLL